MPAPVGPGAHVDFETRSTVNLKTAGVYKYVENPTTSPWGFSWWIDGKGINSIQRWRPGSPDPVVLLEHVANGGRFVAHNAPFERHMWNGVLRKRIVPHWPELRTEQQDCTMSRAAAVAHPMDLDGLGIALRLREKKDREGHGLMMKMARPRKYNSDGSITWWDDPELIERLELYQDQDVRTEIEADLRLPPLTDDEYDLWCFDQKINDRGVYIDKPRIQTLADMVVIAKKEADATMRQLTGRAVPKVTGAAKLVEWLNERGIPAPNMQKRTHADIEWWADTKGDQAAKDAMELRKNTAKTSTAKYAAMLECACEDWRMRGLLAYHAANTGRWAGRLVQPHNYPRLDDEEDARRVAWLHTLLDDGLGPKELYDMIEAVYGPLEPIRLLSVALRSTVEAAPDHEIIGGDFSNIEGRVNAWFAGEQWKLDAFRAYDTILGYGADGKVRRGGPDLYVLTYAKSFGVDPSTVGRGAKRQIGKVQELFLGFQGGVGAFFGPTVKMSPYDVSDPVLRATSAEQWDKACMQYLMPSTKRYDLPEKEWVALKILVDNWRSANGRIVQNWWDLQDAAIQAVMAPGQIVPVCMNRIQYYFDGSVLWCVLPNGRMLSYSNARIDVTKELKVDQYGSTYERIKYTVLFDGKDPETNQWMTRNLYGGLQCENIVQATSRDILVGAMRRVEAAGYPVILTVHDDILTEPSLYDIQRLGLSKERFTAIMSQGETWTSGLPITVDAYQDKRWIH